MAKYNEPVILGGLLFATLTLFSVAFVKAHQSPTGGYAVARAAPPARLLPDDAAKTVWEIAKAEYGSEAEKSYVLVEFGDYQCPPCRMQAGKVKDKVRDAHLKFVFKNYPLSFHALAMPAALAAEAARPQGKFWQMHDQLYASADIGATGISAIQADLGLDTAKLGRDKAGAQQRITEDMKQFAKLKLQGTPSFILRLPDGKTYLLGSFTQIDNFLPQP